MADGFTLDFSELSTLAADLDHAAKGIEKPLISALQFTSVKIKRAAAAKVGRRRHFKQAARAIDFEVKRFTAFGAEVFQSEIGYNKDFEVAPLGSLAEFGAPGSPNALTPGNELQSSLQENSADFEYGVGRALDDTLTKAGL
jgi:hypothetical protein